MVQRERANRPVVALIPQRTERGTTLVETLVAVAIAMVLVAALAALFLGRKPFALRAAVRTLGTLVDEARAVAAASGAGATIAFDADNYGGFTARLYSYRPFPGSSPTAPVDTAAATVSVSLPGIAASPPFAVFLATAGTASAAIWKPSNGTLATEPPCTGALTLRLDDGAHAESHTIPCTDAKLR